MDNPRPEKVAVVTEVRERFDRAGAAILTEYRGLTVKEIAALRRSLRAAGGDYRIYKNTLVRFAARDLGLDDLDSLLTGPTAIAFVDPAVDGGGRRRRGGQGAAGVRQDQPEAGREGRRPRQPGHVGRRHHRPGRPAVPRRAPGPLRRRPGRPAASIRRLAAGHSPQLRLRTEGAHRAGGRQTARPRRPPRSSPAKTPRRSPRPPPASAEGADAAPEPEPAQAPRGRRAPAETGRAPKPAAGGRDVRSGAPSPNPSRRSRNPPSRSPWRKRRAEPAEDA